MQGFVEQSGNKYAEKVNVAKTVVVCDLGMCSQEVQLTKEVNISGFNCTVFVTFFFSQKPGGTRTLAPELISAARDLTFPFLDIVVYVLLNRGKQNY
jgi:hypothetical protein